MSQGGLCGLGIVFRICCLICSYLLHFVRKCSSVSISVSQLGTQPLLPGQPGRPVSTCFYRQAVLTESVLRHGFSHYIVLHRGQVFCHSVFSV